MLVEIAREDLAAVGLSGREYAILAILARDNPESQHELAELLGKTPAVLVAAIDALEERGLVERVRDRSDRRRSRVRLTSPGEQALRRADRVVERVVETVLDGLDGGEREQLDRLLTRGLRLD